MIEPKYLRHHLSEVAEQLKKRGYILDVDTINQLEQKRRALQEKTQDLQNKRNEKSKWIGELKAKGEPIDEIREEVATISSQLKEKQQMLDECWHELTSYYWSIPNIPHDSVPAGSEDEDNELVRSWGDKTQFNFTPRDHVELGELHHKLDLPRATKLAGSRFVVLYEDFALLQRALIQFMLDLHTREHGYQEVYVPYLVNEDSLYGTGQLPKFREDQFSIEGEEQFHLIPTAEVSLTNLVREEILEDQQLPIKMTSHTPCFRSEAGSYGKDTRGIIRQHQFEKVELVHIVRPDQSYEVLENLTQHAEVVLQKLNLPYRVMNLCGGDLGFSAAKTYDVEVWLPGQQNYREISSCSNFEAFQARRMKARWRNPETQQNEPVHTLNGSGVAAGRALVAVIENYQQQDGSVIVPDVLQPYMQREIIKPSSNFKG